MKLQISVALKNGKHNAFNPQEFLSTREFAFYNSLPRHAKTDWAIGRAALKKAFVEYCGISTAEQHIEVINRSNGQPYIKRREDLFYSIAHSHSYGIGAVASRRVGVDIEKVCPRPARILSYIAQDDEIGSINHGVGSMKEQITLIWTIKEAVMKGLGVGVSIYPKSIKIHGRGPQGVFRVAAQQNRSTTQWSVQSTKRGGFFISVALEGPTAASSGS